MSRGAIDFVVLDFPGGDIGNKIAEQLRELSDRDVIKVIDMVFVTRDAAGAIASGPLPGGGGGFERVDRATEGLIGEADIADVAAGLPPGGAACVVVFEHLWSTWLMDAVNDAGGRLRRLGRVPDQVVDAAVAGMAPRLLDRTV